MRYNKHVNIIYMPTQSNENSIHLRENKLLIQKLRGEDPSEYRAMGAAVVSRTDLFRPADFRGARRLLTGPGCAFQGRFASLGQINAYLLAQRRRTKRRAR